MPHGHCYFWNPALLGAQVLTNLIIALAYFSIPVALWVFVKRRQDLRDLQVKGLFIMFALFILFCGTTHLMDILVIWRPYYWIDTGIRLITALLSLATAWVLWPLIPRLLTLPSPSQLRAANQSLEAEIAQRQAREQEISQLNQDLERRVADRTQELIQRTREAEIANRSKSTFLATISHELRTPLNAIIGYSELMLEDLAQGRPGEDQQQDLRHVHSSALHLLDLINEVLDLARIEAGKLTVVEENVAVATLLEDLQRTIQPLAEAQQNRLEVHAQEPLPTLRSDAQRLKQILLNLLSNACKFTHKGLIRLEAAVSGEALVFRVSDTGIGIQPEQLERIFEMFYQADSSYSRQYMGTGLGLAIARGLTEQLGGSLEAASEPGVATVFSLRLPLQPAQ